MVPPNRKIRPLCIIELASFLLHTLVLLRGDVMETKLSVGGFYGARNKRKWLGIERSLDNAVKKHREEKIPQTFRSRLLGPSTKWETFYRQQDAFSYARSTAKDLHVFAFESETFVGGSGQRMYLVASYPVFWHYYSQLSEDKRHHYEVIPEGAVCKLYFDLEYDLSLNTGHDGDKMVDIIIQYVCLCLNREFGLKVSRDDILDLQASTSRKFSRHLIFVLKKAAFRNNIHAGKFVCHIMSQLLDKIKQDSGERACKENKNSELHNNTPDCVKLESASESRTLTRKDGVNSESHKEVSVEEMTPMEDNTHTNSDSIVKNYHTHSNSDSIVKNDLPYLREQSSRNIESKDCEFEIQVANDELQTNEINVNTNSSEVPNSRDTVGNEGQPVRTNKRALMTNFQDILESFSNKDLQSMLVKNKHGDDVLFCDTGVYTKNRNFRLFMSSKLNKNNPLILSHRNQFKTVNGANSEENIFYESLVSNVQYCEKIKILSFDQDSPESLRVRGTHRSSQERNQSAIEGYSKSPYPEVDEFITEIITHNSARGVIRHWTYFQQGELLVYEIARYRFCHNIGREHRSNNIMYIADLRRGIYYQKCHDPDCQIQSFKSQEWPLPSEVLPSHYFDELSDDIDFDVEDDDFLNTTAEMERQYYLNKSKESGEVDMSLEDGDDEELLSALEEVESM